MDHGDQRIHRGPVIDLLMLFQMLDRKDVRDRLLLQIHGGHTVIGVRHPDQLRTGMDEIRMILRKERPEKKKMALIHLHELCADCNAKGMEAELQTEGDLSVIPDDLWEVLLDNCYEAVSNSMKYSKAKKIELRIMVMNQMVRCVVSDNGIGCSRITDGMGISGMRQRIRAAGGTISFETEAGFLVNMLIPLKK